MKFGIIKSKIDYVLSESFKKQNHFKLEMQLFKKNILENKNLTKLFYLYDELSSKKNMDKNIVNDYINECIVIYENSINKIKQSDLTKLNNWLFDVKVENNYENLDSLFNSDVLTIENKIKSRKIISESLTKTEKETKEIINLPISSMLNLANKTINDYIENLNESDRKQIVKLFSTDERDLQGHYNIIKEEVIDKLTNHKENSDSETSKKIDETINKVKNEKFDRLNYVKLKSLNEQL
jgi:rubrerythrin